MKKTHGNNTSRGCGCLDRHQAAAAKSVAQQEFIDRAKEREAKQTVIKKVDK